MPDQPREDRGTGPALLTVAVILAIVATGLIVLLYERAGQQPPGGPEAISLFLSSGELKRLERRRLAPDRSGAFLRPSLGDR